MALFNPHPNPDFERGPRRISDDKLEKITEQHLQRRKIRIDAGQPHAPVVTETLWRKKRDPYGHVSWYPSARKVVVLDEKISKLPNHDQHESQTKMLMEDKNRALHAGGADIDPMAF